MLVLSRDLWYLSIDLLSYKSQIVRIGCRCVGSRGKAAARPYGAAGAVRGARGVGPWAPS